MYTSVFVYGLAAAGAASALAIPAGVDKTSVIFPREPADEFNIAAKIHRPADYILPREPSGNDDISDVFAGLYRQPTAARPSRRSFRAYNVERSANLAAGLLARQSLATSTDASNATSAFNSTVTGQNATDDSQPFDISSLFQGGDESGIIEQLKQLFSGQGGTSSDFLSTIGQQFNGSDIGEAAGNDTQSGNSTEAIPQIGQLLGGQGGNGSDFLSQISQLFSGNGTTNGTDIFSQLFSGNGTTNGTDFLSQLTQGGNGSDFLSQIGQLFGQQGNGTGSDFLSQILSGKEGANATQTGNSTESAGAFELPGQSLVTEANPLAKILGQGGASASSETPEEFKLPQGMNFDPAMIGQLLNGQAGQTDATSTDAVPATQASGSAVIEQPAESATAEETTDSAALSDATQSVVIETATLSSAEAEATA